LDQTVAVFFLFAAQEAEPIDAKLGVPKVKATEDPRTHHLPALLDDVHFSSQPEVHKLPDVLLVREGLGSNRRVMLVPGLCVPEEPVFGIPGAPAPLLLFQGGFQINLLLAAEMA
jgi:hypothetical protein